MKFNCKHCIKANVIYKNESLEEKHITLHSNIALPAEPAADFHSYILVLVRNIQSGTVQALDHIFPP